MGNKNDYLTLEDSARMLGRPVSVLKSVMSEGKIGAKLAGGRWWISLRDIEKIRESLPSKPAASQPEEADNDLLPKRPPGRPRRAPEPVERSNARVGSERKRERLDREANLEKLDATVRGLAAQIEVGLAQVVGGKAVWNKIREDQYNLNPARRAALPKKVVGSLSELQKAKQRYIVLREVPRYKGLLRSLPVWNTRRGAAPQKRVVATPQKAPPIRPKKQQQKQNTPTDRKNAGERKREAALRKKADQQKINESPPKKAGQRKGKLSLPKGRKGRQQTLELLQAANISYLDRVRREAGYGSESKKRTEKRYWWNEED